MFPPSPPACLKRKTSSTHSTSNKRIRLSGVFSPRLIVPTGARRTWGFTKPPRFILDPIAVQGAKRTLTEDEDVFTPSNCKVRLLDNRDALFLPGYKRLPTKKQRKRSLSTSSPSKKSLEVVRLRRREQFKRRLQRVDSGICMDSDEDIDLDTVVVDSSPFDGFAFTGLTVDMGEAMETTATATEGDDMDIEDAIISTDATTAAASREGDTDSGSVSTEQATSSSKEEELKDMVIDEVKREGVEEEETKEIEVEREEDRDSGIDVELSDADEKDPEQKEVDEQLSPKETHAKEKAPKRLSIDELVTSTKSAVKKEEEEADDEDDEPPRRPTRRRSAKPSVLPTTVEEEEEEEQEGGCAVKRSLSKPTIKEDEEVESEKETEKEERKEKKRLLRRKCKVEEAGSEASENEDEKKSKKKVVKEEVKEQLKEEAKVEAEVEGKQETVETDKMEEDTEEVLRHTLEDTDMNTDEDYVPAVAEQTQFEDSVVADSPAEEDVTMSEDEDIVEKIIEDISAEQLQNEAKQEKDVETNKIEEPTDIETPDTVIEDSPPPQVPTIEVKKTVRRLVLAPSRLDEFEISKMMLSVPKTPKTPRSPSMSRFNITMSKAPRKLETILSPRRKKFGKSEDLAPHWTLRRLAAKKSQLQPFNPANVSRHAYRDPISDEDHLTASRSFCEDEDVDDVYADDQYQRADWPIKAWGASTWMTENGSALIEFCVRKLEGFKITW